MKFMDTINELQAKLTKLRREIQRSEAEKVKYSPAIDPHKCFVCGEPADMGWGNPLGPTRGYCRKHKPNMGTAGDVVVDPPIFRSVDMGKHTFSTVESIVCECGKIYVLSEKTDKKKSTPALPLHVKVAKALGEACWTEQDGTWRSNLGKSIPHREYPLVPDYPNDFVAAMGALFEYGEKTGWHVSVGKRQYGRPIWIKIGNMNYEFAESPPQAICEAICAHSEQRT